MTEPCLPGMFSTPERVEIHPVAAERQRLNAAALRVLDFLKSRGRAGALNYELCAPDVGGNRGIGRIHELREAGWDITKEHERGGVWRYELRGYR